MVNIVYMINWKKSVLRLGVLVLTGLIYCHPLKGQAPSTEMVIEIEHKVKKGRRYTPSARSIIAAWKN